MSGGSVATLDVAWLAPGASNATQIENQQRFVQFVTSLMNFTYARIVQSYISAPLCEARAGECECTSCVAPAAAQKATDNTLMIPVAVAVAIAVAVGLEQWRVRRRDTYPWLRRTVLAKAKPTNMKI